MPGDVYAEGNVYVFHCIFSHPAQVFLSYILPFAADIAISINLKDRIF